MVLQCPRSPGMSSLGTHAAVFVRQQGALSLEMSLVCVANAGWQDWVIFTNWDTFESSLGFFENMKYPQKWWCYGILLTRTIFLHFCPNKQFQNMVCYVFFGLKSGLMWMLRTFKFSFAVYFDNFWLNSYFSSIFQKWGCFIHQLAIPVPSISCCVLNHHNLLYQIQNALAFNRDTCWHLVLCLWLLPFHWAIFSIHLVTLIIHQEVKMNQKLFSPYP